MLLVPLASGLNFLISTPIILLQTQPKIATCFDLLKWRPLADSLENTLDIVPECIWSNSWRTRVFKNDFSLKGN